MLLSTLVQSMGKHLRGHPSLCGSWRIGVFDPAKLAMKTEQKFVYGWASIVLAVVLYLILRGEPLKSENYYQWTRILISFSIAVLGATIPGFLNVAWKGAGLSIRAAGALGLFVVTFFGSPKVLSDIAPVPLPNAKVSLLPFASVDFRTQMGPDRPEADRLAAPMTLSAAMVYENEQEPSRVALVDSERATLRIRGKPVVLDARYFVKQVDGIETNWLGIVDDARAVNVSSGAREQHETAFTQSSLSWGGFLTSIEQVASTEFEIAITATVDGGVITRNCVPDMEFYRKALSEWGQGNQGSIMRATIPCV